MSATYDDYGRWMIESDIARQMFSHGTITLNEAILRIVDASDKLADAAGLVRAEEADDPVCVHDGLPWSKHPDDRCPGFEAAAEDIVSEFHPIYTPGLSQPINDDEVKV